ncbi:unnamed protein product [Lupinus luteus]|uniref:Endoplasmic reticulum vesicle transporter N-terminal domain-containing protein n=1 Tax=Lupinus luteus TaxID=3873 RepID=A0AAV1WEQ5_LUPLU
MDGIMSMLRNLDAYPKINEDFYSRTLSGGVITIASSIFMLLLFFSELRNISLLIKLVTYNAFPFRRFLFILLRFDVIVFLTSLSYHLELTLASELYFHAATETKLVVDTSRGETLRINFDVTFPALPCSILGIDAMDISGEQHLDVVCILKNILVFSIV